MAPSERVSQLTADGSLLSHRRTRIVLVVTRGKALEYSLTPTREKWRRHKDQLFTIRKSHIKARIDGRHGILCCVCGVGSRLGPFLDPAAVYNKACRIGLLVLMADLYSSWVRSAV